MTTDCGRTYVVLNIPWLYILDRPHTMCQPSMTTEVKRTLCVNIPWSQNQTNIMCQHNTTTEVKCTLCVNITWPRRPNAHYVPMYQNHRVQTRNMCQHILPQRSNVQYLSTYHDHISRIKCIYTPWSLITEIRRMYVPHTVTIKVKHTLCQPDMTTKVKVSTNRNRGDHTHIYVPMYHDRRGQTHKCVDIKWPIQRDQTYNIVLAIFKKRLHMWRK